MRWETKWGTDHIELFLGILADTGRVVGALQEMPLRTFDHTPYIQAFNRLQSEREIGMDVGPIRWTAISAYAERYGFTGDAFEKLEAIIMALDVEMRSQAKTADAAKKDEPEAPADPRAQQQQPKKRLSPEELASAMAAAGKFGRR